MVTRAMRLKPLLLGWVGWVWGTNREWGFGALRNVGDWSQFGFITLSFFLIFYFFPSFKITLSRLV